MNRPAAMDDIVRQAMARWPDVPAVYGWLRLDERGRWLIKGDPIANPIVKAFIDRNYLCDDGGRWYFQNGPQRVFVELAYTPYVCRVWPTADGVLAAETHNELAIEQPRRCWLDDAGGVLIESEHGIACVESQSLTMVADALRLDDDGACDEHTLAAVLRGERPAGTVHLRWNGSRLPLGLIPRREVPARFHFDPSPQPPAGAPPC